MGEAMLRFATFVALLLVLPATAAPTRPIKLDSGPVIGVRADGVESFKGIPYAKPPVGALRWRAPQPVAPWAEPRVSDAFGKICPQLPRPAGLGPEVRLEDMSEDCLTVNVFRPTGGKAKLPVLVWIHGGGLTAGSSAVPVYDGAPFAKGGVVLVSFNYRLGRLGVFAHPALTRANGDGGQLGNYLLMDQIAALQWVQRNIAAFGGDPGNVTVFGESAGAYSIDALMTAPPARGLFHRAISQSGYGRGYQARLSVAAPNGRKSAEAEGVEIAEQLGLKDADLAALRALPAGKLAELLRPGAIVEFVVDGTIIADDMWAVYRAGREAPIPFILGSNSQETPGVDSLDTPALRGMIPADQDEALSKAYGGRALLLTHVSGDFVFTQQTRALARLHAKNGHPSYLYMFGTVSPAQLAEGRGAVHAAELRYVFDTLHTGPAAIQGPADRNVARMMNAFWRSFAADGDPNGRDLPPWPRYDGDKVMVFGNGGAEAIPDARNPRLDALSAVVDPKS
jgi:para-nitrobenzyl esterase